MVLQVSPKPKLRKGLWSPEEDEKLVRYISKFGHKCWSIVPKQAGLQRCGKSCRLRWINYLRPDLKRGQFSDEEESMIIKLHSMLGNRWAQIATQLPGRTDNEIKNFWNSCLRKKLRQFGIDPNTHKPILDFPVKLGAQSEFEGEEVLDSILKLSDSTIHQTSISSSRSSSRTYSGQCVQQLQHQGCGQSGNENTFSLSMLPITLGPSQRNLQLQPHLLPIPKACYSHDHESLVDDQSCILGQSSPSDFSSHESSTETGCSEKINTPFPWDQSCSANDGLIRSWSSDSSWGFPEWTEMGLLEC